MFFDFFALELKQRFKSISTYVFFLIPFVMMFFTESARDFSPVPNGKVFLNGPWALTICFVQLTAFGSILISAIFGPSILRDFQLDTYPLLFTKPISKFDYLGGRWAASFVITILVFSGVIFGALVVGLMPWADTARIAPMHFWTYLQPFLSITVVQIFFLGSLFFCVAALTRRIVVVYLQGVILFAIYLILLVSVVTSNNLDRTWPSISDPLGIVLMDGITRYWTVAERNSQFLHWSGTFLANPWCGSASAWSPCSSPTSSSLCPPKFSARVAPAAAPKQPAPMTKPSKKSVPMASRCRSPLRYSISPPRSPSSGPSRGCASPTSPANSSS